MGNPAGKSERTALDKFQIVILVLSVYVLAALLVQTIFRLSPETDILIDRIDFIICMVFLFHFFWRLYHAKNKGAFLKWGWIDLVSSIPAFDLLRLGRLVRLIRILRVVRAFRSTKHLVRHLSRNRAETTFATVALICFLMVLSSSIAILNVEDAPDSNIKTPSDALWWSFFTFTTVGYGNKFPATPEGKVITALLTTAGIALLGVFTALLADRFITSAHKKDAVKIQQLTEEVRLLKEQTQSLEKRSS